LVIAFEDFQAVDMRVGRVLEVADFPQARVAAWRLRIDFGPELGERNSSAQITHYARGDLEGRLVVAVVNLPARRVGPFVSEVLVLGALDPVRGVVLVAPDGDAQPGSRIG
jgi:tRNA-binding protein